LRFIAEDERGTFHGLGAIEKKIRGVPRRGTS